MQCNFVLGGNGIEGALVYGQQSGRYCGLCNSARHQVSICIILQRQWPPDSLCSRQSLCCWWQTAYINLSVKKGRISAPVGQSTSQGSWCVCAWCCAQHVFQWASQPHRKASVNKTISRGGQWKGMLLNKLSGVWRGYREKEWAWLTVVDEGAWNDVGTTAEVAMYAAWQMVLQM